MSGRRIHTNKYQQFDRRQLIKQLLAFTGAVTLINSCKTENTYAHITGALQGANHHTGHLLRKPEHFAEPTEVIFTDILIAGGGISGLSAKRWLEKEKAGNVMMIELDNTVGGNSICGQNSVSAYPWAAHYLPIPDNANKDLLDFLSSANVITGYNSLGLPIYNEYHLCHEPEERLYINGYWQEGLIPQFGVDKKDRQQIAEFLNLTETLKHEKGRDGLYHFNIPVDNSSTDVLYKHLDNISFRDFLAEKGFTSHYLLWYLNYCCKDDYGADLDTTSAWAGLHYFASRRGAAGNAVSSDVLTWPEGNGYLMKALQSQCRENIRTGMMIYKVAIQDEQVHAYCYDTKSKATLCIKAGKLLLCTPQYINKRILPESLNNRRAIYDKASYAPWVVANITFSRMPKGNGMPISWDNVIYNQPSVGYVYANHQDLSLKKEGVITYYLPIISHDTNAARQSIYDKNYEYWKDYIIKELEYAHEGITEVINNIDIWIWGHGMIRPTLGYISGEERRLAMQPIENKIFFAHSDLSGISIFEEAFYQGIRAARQICSTR